MSALQGWGRSGGLDAGRGHDFRRRLRGEFELEALQQKQVVAFRLGMTGQEDGSAVGRGKFDVDHLDRGDPRT